MLSISLILLLLFASLFVLCVYVFRSEEGGWEVRTEDVYVSERLLIVTSLLGHILAFSLLCPLLFTQRCSCLQPGLFMRAYLGLDASQKTYFELDLDLALGSSCSPLYAHNNKKKRPKRTPFTKQPEHLKNIKTTLTTTNDMKKNTIYYVMLAIATVTVMAVSGKVS